jgi:hypothetical protein
MLRRAKRHTYRGGRKVVSTVRIVACDTYERGDSAVAGGDGRGRTGTLRLAPSRCCRTPDHVLVRPQTPESTECGVV